MKVAVFNTKPYDRQFLETVNAQFNHKLAFFEPHLNSQTVALAKDFPAVCIFVNDHLDRPILKSLAEDRAYYRVREGNFALNGLLSLYLSLLN